MREDDEHLLVALMTIIHEQGVPRVLVGELTLQALDISSELEMPSPLPPGTRYNRYWLGNRLVRLVVTSTSIESFRTKCRNCVKDQEIEQCAPTTMTLFDLIVYGDEISLAFVP